MTILHVLFDATKKGTFEGTHGAAVDGWLRRTDSEGATGGRGKDFEFTGGGLS
jgi:hypothetical protein